jgi:hypothetical protein
MRVSRRIIQITMYDIVIIVDGPMAHLRTVRMTVTQFLVELSVDRGYRGLVAVRNVVSH